MTILHCFCAYSVIFSDLYFFADHENVLWRIPAYSTYLKCDILHFSAYYDIVYCSWTDLAAIYMQILHICSTWKTRDGRKCIKKIGVLGVSGLKK